MLFIYGAAKNIPCWPTHMHEKMTIVACEHTHAAIGMIPLSSIYN